MYNRRRFIVSDACDMDRQDQFEIVMRHPTDGVVLLALRGEVDVCTSIELMESLIDAFAEHPEVVAVDLSELRSWEPAGLGVLLEGGRNIEDAGVRFVVILPSDQQLAQLPLLSDLHDWLNVCESVEDALAPWMDEAGQLQSGV